MSVFHATLQRDWITLRGLYLDYLVAALVAVALLQGDNALGFAVIGSMLACSLGARIGGEDTLHGTWEFTLTRPVRRARWLKIRFGSGLVALCALLALVITADNVDLSERVGRLLADPIANAPPVLAVEACAYLEAAAMVLFVYAVTFHYALREKAPERVLHHRLSGLLSGVLGSALLTGVAQMAFHALRGPGHHDFGTPAPDWAGAVVHAVALTAAAGIVVLLSRMALVRVEVVGSPARPGEDGAGGGSAALWIVALVLVVLVLVLLFLLAAPGVREVGR